MWYKTSPVGSLELPQSTRVTDRQTDNNYDCQDRASIVASRGKNDVEHDFVKNVKIW